VCVFHPLRSLAARCASVRLSTETCGYRGKTAGLFSIREAEPCSEGRVMQRLMLACTVLLSVASPLRSQQSPPNQSIPEQAVPPPEFPPPSSQPASDLPPFIPPPRARLYDNDRPASHYRAKASHHRAVHHHPRARHSAARRRHATHRAVHLTRRTIRLCHAMTYRQIMRHGTCRELMRRELRARGNRHHHASHHRSFSRHHRAGHRHRR